MTTVTLPHPRSQIHCAKSVVDIKWHNLKSRGVKWVVFDIENTLEPITHGRKEFRPETIRFLVKLSDMGFKFCFATNSSSDFSYMLEQLKVPYGIEAKLVQPGAGKMPRKSWYGRFGHQYFYWVLTVCGNPAPGDVIMVGDKLEYDVLPAVEVGMRGFWVRRLGPDVKFKGIPVEAHRRLRESIHRRLLRLPKP